MVKVIEKQYDYDGFVILMGPYHVSPPRAGIDDGEPDQAGDLHRLAATHQEAKDRREKICLALETRIRMPRAGRPCRS